MRVESGSPARTERIGRALGALLDEGDLVLLSGELGSGKTRFVKGLAEGFGACGRDEVVSPTFLRLEEYGPRGRRLRHLDAYRMAGPRAVEAIGEAEVFGPGGVAVVEWPERIEGALPPDGLLVSFEHAGPRRRALSFSPRGPRGEALLAGLREALGTRRRRRKR